MIYLSAPKITESDIEAVVSALRSGWIAPAGPDLLAFESEVAALVGVKNAVGLSSGTSAIQLALRYLNVGPSDYVLVPTATFAATAFAVTYSGAIPVFIDSDGHSGNIDHGLILKAVQTLRSQGKRVNAAVPVDLYGTPVNYGELAPLLAELEVPFVEDAAEGLGGSNDGMSLGSFGEAGVLSFNGNKLITTSGGGMLLTNNEDMAAKVRFWSSQAREDFPWYEHKEIGHNYRLSNILAALGRSQLRRVADEVDLRRMIREAYRSRLTTLPGVSVQQDPSWGFSNAWLTVARFDARLYPDAATLIRQMLAGQEVESRPVWKPMHRQPVFQSHPAFLNGEADRLFQEGLCLPSGGSVTLDQVERISSLILNLLTTLSLR